MYGHFESWHSVYRSGCAHSLISVQKSSCRVLPLLSYPDKVWAELQMEENGIVIRLAVRSFFDYVTFNRGYCVVEWRLLFIPIGYSSKLFLVGIHSRNFLGYFYKWHVLDMPSVIYIHCSPYKSHQSQSSNLQDIRNKISHLHFYKLRRLHRCNHGFHHRTHRYPDMYRFYLIVIQKIFIKDSKNLSFWRNWIIWLFLF